MACRAGKGGGDSSDNGLSKNPGSALEVRAPAQPFRDREVIRLLDLGGEQLGHPALMNAVSTGFGPHRRSAPHPGSPQLGVRHVADARLRPPVGNRDPSPPA